MPDDHDRENNGSGWTIDRVANTDSTRREAILKIGRFGAYTAPALLIMMTGNAYAQADSLVFR